MVSREQFVCFMRSFILDAKDAEVILSEATPLSCLFLNAIDWQRLREAARRRLGLDISHSAINCSETLGDLHAVAAPAFLAHASPSANGMAAAAPTIVIWASTAANESLIRRRHP